MSTIIKVENLSKQYRLGKVGTGTLSHDVNRLWHKIRGMEDPFLQVGDVNDRTSKASSDYVWALKDINFEVGQGEVLGIIGRNGAGKSTLLKILSRTTTPTTGNVKIKGRIASLLEVGTGFHPELSGRENIFLNGAILGMTKHEIKTKFDQIVDFSGVERYIDTPVKRYSSGMYVRLAFAVAAHLEPEILIVDEVLAVGDVEFQKKALGKMQDVSNNQGRTVLFVSHNLSSLRSLCTRGLLMINGQLISQGPIVNIINEYEKKFIAELKPEWTNPYDRDTNTYLDTIRILDKNNEVKDSFLTTEDIQIEMTIVMKESIEYVKVGFELMKNQEVVFRAQQVDVNKMSTFTPGIYTITGKINKLLLNEGEYYIRPLFSVHYVKSLMKIYEEVLSFKVQIDHTISDYHANLNAATHPGVIFPALNWDIKKVN